MFNLAPDFKTSPFSLLLIKLAAGADKPLYTPGDWANRLVGAANGSGDPASRQFASQLQQEWYPLSVPDPLCQSMLDYARDYLMGGMGWPHLWAHILRVTALAMVLAPEAGVEPDHAFMLGVFHDIGKLDELAGGEAHQEIGARLLRERLGDRYSALEITLMANAIAKKTGSLNPYTQLLFDADKLDKIGATGIARRLSISAGTSHIAPALQRIQQDAAIFPPMHFPTSQALERLKLTFTRQFLNGLGISSEQ